MAIVALALTACQANIPVDKLTTEESITNPQYETFDLNGQITARTRVKFDEFANSLSSAKSKVIVITLNSPGGVLGTTVGMVEKMKSLQKRGFTIIAYVGDNKYCASACTILFSYADHRFAHANSRWMFHSPWVVRPDFDPSNPTAEMREDYSEESLQWMQKEITTARETLRQAYVKSDPTFAEFLQENYITKLNKNYRLTGKELDEKTSSYVTKTIE